MPLLVTQALHTFATPTLDSERFNFVKRLTETFVQMPRSKAGVPKEEPKTASLSGRWEDIAGEKGTREG